MKPTTINLSEKKRIKELIIDWLMCFSEEHLEKMFYAINLIKFIQTLIRPNIYGDTVLRYMRELREDGLIDYETVGCKADSCYLLKSVKEV